MIVKMNREALIKIAQHEKQPQDQEAENYSGYAYSFNIYLDVASGEYYIKDKDGNEIVRTDGSSREGLEDLFFYIRGLMEQKTVH